MNSLAKTLMLLFFSAMPFASWAQCACSNPEEGGTVTHVIELPLNNFSTNIIKVPKLDPNIGQVTCVDINYTYTLLSSVSVRNKESVPKGYRFLYNVNPSLSVGTATHTDTYLKYYPSISDNVNLAPYGEDGDFQLFGPDTIALDQNTNFSQAINPALFNGSGDVDLMFEFSGGVTSILGGVNYEQAVSTESWGEFTITIGWCPNSVLNDDLQNFSLRNTVDGIQLNWLNTSENVQNQYVIQISKDGNTFIDYATISSNNDGNYQYVINNLDWSKVYVRVKMISPDTKVSYTPIKMTQRGQSDNRSLLISPNPVIDQTTIYFPRALTGQYKMELIGGNGQIAHSQFARLANQSNYQLKVPKLASGIYYLRVLSVTNNETYLTKVYISN